MSRKPQIPWLALVPLVFISLWWVRGLRPLWRDIPEYQFGWLVLMLAGYLVWERLEERRGRQPELEPPKVLWAWVWFLPGFGIFLVAEAYAYVFAITPAYSLLLSMACIAMAVASLLAGFGSKTTRAYVFPILFLLVAVPLPKIFWNPIVLGLQSLVASVDVELLNLIGIASQKQGSLIRLPNCLVGIDEACSGIRSLQSSIMVALFIGDLTMNTRTARIVLFGVGVAMALVGNIIRSLYLALIAARQGAEAIEEVHDAAGWGMLAFTTVGIALFTWSWCTVEKRLIHFSKPIDLKH